MYIEDELIYICKTSEDFSTLGILLDLEANQTNDRWICVYHWSIETRDSKSKHVPPTCKLLSKQFWSSCFGEKIASKDKVWQLAKEHNKTQQESIKLPRYTAIVDNRSSQEQKHNPFDLISNDTNQQLHFIQQPKLLQQSSQSILSVKHLQNLIPSLPNLNTLNPSLTSSNIDSLSAPTSIVVKLIYIYVFDCYLEEKL